MTIASAALVGPACAALMLCRVAGAAAFGWFAAGWAVADVVSRVASFGFDRGLPGWLASRDTAGDRAATRRGLRMALFMALPASVIATLAGGTVVRLLGPLTGASPALLSAVAITLFAVPGLVVSRICTALSLAKHVGRHAVVSRLGGSAVSVLAILLIAPSRQATHGPALAAIAGASASGVLAFACARRLYVEEPRTPVLDGETSALFACSLPGGIEGLLAAATRQVSLLVLAMTGGTAATAESLGAYGVALAIAGVLRAVPRAVQPATDEAVDLWQGGAVAEGEALFTSVVRWTLGLLVLVGGFLFLCGTSTLALAGPLSSASGAVGSMLVLVAAFVLWGAGAPARVALIRARPALAVMSATAACAVAIWSAMAFAPVSGAGGAARSVLLASATGTVVAHVALLVLAGWRWHVRRLVAPIVAAAAGAAVAFVAIAMAGAPPSAVASPVWAAPVFVVAFAIACWRIPLNRSDRVVLDRLAGRNHSLIRVPA